VVRYDVRRNLEDIAVATPIVHCDIACHTIPHMCIAGRSAIQGLTPKRV
jgi:hypothetical protein